MKLPSTLIAKTFNGRVPNHTGIDTREFYLESKNKDIVSSCGLNISHHAIIDSSAAAI